MLGNRVKPVAHGYMTALPAAFQGKENQRKIELMINKIFKRYKKGFFLLQSETKIRFVVLCTVLVVN